MDMHLPSLREVMKIKGKVTEIVLIGIFMVYMFLNLFFMLAFPTKGSCESCSVQACVNDNECGFYCKCFRVDPSKTHGQCLINY